MQSIEKKEIIELLSKQDIFIGENIKQKNSILSSMKAYSENKEAGEHGLTH